VTLPLPADLPPEVYPLAWLIGHWEGEGTIGYGPIPPGRVRQRLYLTSDGGPYLSYGCKTWLEPDLPTDRAASDAQTETGSGTAGTASGTAGAASGTAGTATTTAANLRQPVDKLQLWHQESGFWRITPGQKQIDPPFEVEVLLADPGAFLSLYIGQVDGPRIRLATDTMVRTESAAPVGAATRMYGLVGGELLWAWDIAGFGLPLGSYLALRLHRTDTP
jgi:hypothetical protein